MQHRSVQLLTRTLGCTPPAAACPQNVVSSDPSLTKCGQFRPTTSLTKCGHFRPPHNTGQFGPPHNTGQFRHPQFRHNTGQFRPPHNTGQFGHPHNTGQFRPPQFTKCGSVLDRSHCNTTRVKSNNRGVALDATDGLRHKDAGNRNMNNILAI